MAKRARRVLQARKEQRDDDSLLVRSAESLGRVIGSLQRQVQDGVKRVSSLTEDAIDTVPELPRLQNPFAETKRSPRKRSGTRATGAGRSKKATRTAGARKRKSSPARKTSASSQRSGPRKTSKKR